MSENWDSTVDSWVIMGPFLDPRKVWCAWPFGNACVQVGGPDLGPFERDQDGLFPNLWQV